MSSETLKSSPGVEESPAIITNQKALPVLPVRDTVLFPHAVLPLTVGRESSLALVNALQGEEKMLGVVAQHDPRVEDPAAADLALSRAISCLVRGSKVVAAWKACFRIFILSIPVITTDVGRLKE